MHTRQIYTGLDWLGDVGGLLDGLKLVGKVFIFILKFLFGNPLDYFLLQSLYKNKDLDKKESLNNISTIL